MPESTKPEASTLAEATKSESTIPESTSTMPESTTVCKTTDPNEHPLPMVVAKKKKPFVPHPGNKTEITRFMYFVIAVCATGLTTMLVGLIAGYFAWNFQFLLIMYGFTAVLALQLMMTNDVDGWTVLRGERRERRKARERRKWLPSSMQAPM